MVPAAIGGQSRSWRIVPGVPRIATKQSDDPRAKPAAGPAAAREPRRGGRFRRFRRVCLRCLAIGSLVLVIVAAALWMTQPWWLPSFAGPIASRLIGTPVSAKSARLTITGRLRATGVSLGSSADPDSPVVTIERAEASLRWGASNRPGPSFRDVILESPVVRIRPAAGVAGATSPAQTVGRIRRALRGVFELPGVEVIDGSLIFADARDETVLTITGVGSFQRRAGRPGVYDLSVEQVGAGDPIRLEGWIDLNDRAARLETRGILLTDWFESVTIARDSQTWREIVTAGRLDHAVVEYSPDDGLSTRMQIHEARLVVPVRADQGNDPTPLVFDEVHGVVSLTERGVEAQVSGLVGGLPTLATLRTNGLSLTSPFNAELVGGPFVVDTGWPALALAPSDVRAVIDDFSSPEARIGAKIRLSRNETSRSFDAGVSVSGEIDLTDGAITFVEFLYPVRDIAGRVEFDETEIRLVGLTGAGPTGASVSADGVVTPTPAGAALDLTISADDAPVDDALLAALSEDEAEIVRSLFDRETFAALRDAGLPIETFPGQKAFGEPWRANVRVRVRRFPDRMPRHEVTVDAEFPRADLLYSEFPYPVRAEGMRLRITRDSAEVLHAPLVGPTGAKGALAGIVTWNDRGARPDLDIHFNDAPVDALLIAAIERAEGSIDGSSAEMLRDLGAGGRIVGDATIGVDDAGEIAWSVRASLAGLTLAPEDNADTPARASAGVLHADSAGWRIEDAVVRLGADSVRLSADAAFSGERTVRLRAESDRLSLDAPIIGFIRLFDTDAANRLDTLRSDFAPQGAVRASLDATIAGDEAGFLATVEPISEAAFTVAGERVRLRPTGGRVVADVTGVNLNDLSFTTVDANTEHAGSVRVSGGFSSITKNISINATDIAFDGALARAVVASAYPDLLDEWRESGASGLFDARAELTGDGADRLRVETGELRPRSLAFTRAGRRVTFDHIEGAVTLGATGGAVESLSLESDGWTAHASGDWLAGDTPGVRLSLGASGDRLGAEIFALLPADVRDVLDAVDFHAEQGFALRDATLAVNWPEDTADVGDGFRDGLLFTGSLEVRGASLDPGVPIEQINGSAVIRVARPPAVGETTLELAVHATSAMVLGVRVEGVRGLIARSADASDRLDLHFETDVHDGAAVVDGTVTGDPDSDGRYSLDIRLAGVDLAALLEDRTGESDDAGARGSLDASLILAGSARGPTRGAGEIRIQGGELLRLPLVVTILELGNVLPPIGERLDYANAVFTLDDDRATFERLVAVSPTISLIGVGDVRLPDFDLDLRFGVSANRRLPIFTPLFDALRNELLTTRVRGTLADPDISAEPLSGIRRLISRILGGG